MLVYNKLSRRLFLKTASGFVLALPLIPSLISKAASAAEADILALDDTPNIILVRTMYGMFESQRYIHNVPGQLPEHKWQATKFSNGSSLKEREYILRTKELSDYQVGDSHYSINDWLGTSLQEKGLLEYATIPLGNTTFHGCNHQNTTVYAACTEDDNKDPIIKQSSIDVLIEERLNALSPGHKAIRIMPANRLTTGSGSCSYRYNKITGRFENLPVIRDVEVLFNLFFKAPETNTEALNKSAMDSVIEEYRELSKQVSYAESINLEQYGDEMQRVSKLLDEPKRSCSQISMPSTAGNFEPKYLAANTLISHIVSCGISKLVCYEITHYHPSERNASAFAASHHPREKDTLNANKDIFNRDIIQDLAAKMKRTSNNSGGNLLDDSLIYQASEDNWNHVGDGGPAFLMLGKAKGRVNAGKIYDYRIREVEDFDPTDDSDHLIYRIGRNMNDSAPHFGAVGWSPYYLLLEGIMQVAGLKREDYLLPGQFCYGHSEENWNLYGGILRKIDKFTDTDTAYKSRFRFGTRWYYRDMSEIIYLEDPSNFSSITPGMFNV